MRPRAARKRGAARPCPLAPREIEILGQIAVGRQNRVIAERLGISEQTVKNTVVVILKKAHAPNATGAVVLALRHGWLRLRDLEVELREPAPRVA